MNKKKLKTYKIYSIFNENEVIFEYDGENLEGANLESANLEGANLKNTQTKYCIINFRKTEYEQAKQFIEGLKK